MTESLTQLREHAEQVAQREGCTLYDVELTGQGQGRILRVFIDKDDSDGVSIDDCSRVSRGLSLVLDVEDLVPGGAYHLEVSSPGLERRLTQPWHFAKAVGERVQLQLNKGLGEFVASKSSKADEKRKKLNVLINEAKDNAIVVTMDDAAAEDETFTVPLEFIHKAKVLYAFENSFSNKKPKGRKG
jgi:ribosome maturation factor RimP